MEEVLVFLHVLFASVWVGGHLVLALALLPAARKTGDVHSLCAFEERYEPLAAPSLVGLILTGLLLAWWEVRPDGGAWIGFADGLSTLLTIKVLLVVATLGLALDAKLRLGGGPTRETMEAYAWHARTVTVLAVLLLAAGVGLRVVRP